MTPWTVAHQAPLSMDFSRREYWSGLPFPSLGDLPKPGIELRSPSLQADSLHTEPPGKPFSSVVGVSCSDPVAGGPQDSGRLLLVCSVGVLRPKKCMRNSQVSDRV